MENKNKMELSRELILSFYKDRYDEARVSYRRLEDKVNYLVAVIGLEATALLAIFSTVDSSKISSTSIYLNFCLLFLFSCMVSVIFSFYYLWHSLGLKGLPKVVGPRSQEAHNFFLTEESDKVVRYLMVIYGVAVNKIETLHKVKAVYVQRLFNAVALSFVLLITSVLFLFFSKV